MTCAVYGFPDGGSGSVELATELGLRHHEVGLRHFPDGESLLRIEQPATCALLYRSLDNANAKLVELMLAASALRASGTARVMLIAPYLCYMRQDAAFHTGEAVSQRVVGQFIASHFDGLVTVDPHLHRTASLDAIMPGIETLNVSAAPLLASAIDRAEDPLLFTPDVEGEQWVRQVAQAAGLDFVLGQKQRQGDRQVLLTMSQPERIDGRHVVIIDDIISSGATILVATRQLLAAGAASVDVLATHCLAGEREIAALRDAGVRSIRATSTVPGSAAVLSATSLLADAIGRQVGSWEHVPGLLASPAPDNTR